MKKIISIFVALAIIFGTVSVFSVSSSAKGNSLGDTNSDGAINSFDALVIIRYCTGDITLKPEELSAADVDGNDKINSTDALYILHYSVGKIFSFPASDETNSGRVKIFGSFWYDPATGQVTDEAGNGLLGFSYDASEGIFYASNNAWQRTFGYTYIYDVAAPFIVCMFDTSRIYFEYDNKEWMVQMWKGQYGFVLIGCEIGLYYRDFDDDYLVDNKGRKYYKCADDDMLIKMSLSLYKNGNLMFNRRQQYSWWLTGFMPGMLSNIGITSASTAQLRVDATLTFESDEMLDAFVGGLKKCTVIQNNASKDERTYKFVKNSNYFINRAACSVSFSWQ